MSIFTYRGGNKKKCFAAKSYRKTTIRYYFQDGGGIQQRRGSHDQFVNTNPRAGMVYHQNLGPHHHSRPPRRGVSVPDLDTTSNTESPESPITVEVEHEEEINNALSPRSAPASPRKYSNNNNNSINPNDPFSGHHHHKHPDSVSLESSPQR